MCLAGWHSFVLAARERRLPRNCSLVTVQKQLYRLYRQKVITAAQWSEFEADLHQLEPALPWLG
jgi:hypothetical protein